jgi:hypothetical protein
MVKREIRDQLVFGSGLVTIGMALGTVSPSVGAITSAVGGAKFGAELLSSGASLLGESPVTRDSDFYFLWKARDKGSHPT